MEGQGKDTKGIVGAWKMNTLHRVIPDSKLPEPLKKKLVFGNRKQIDALRALETDINIMETEQAKIADGNLKYFEVCIAYSGEQYVKVLAVDEADAKKKAQEETCMDDADMEIDYVNAREVKPCLKKTK